MITAFPVNQNNTIPIDTKARENATLQSCPGSATVLRLALWILLITSVPFTAIAQDGSGGMSTDIREQPLIDDEYDPNIAPSISGAAAPSVLAGDVYTFTPSARDADGHSLRYSIANLPHWALFDNLTGELAGIALEGDVGDYPDISVSVSDGFDSVNLPPFTLTVLSAMSTKTAGNESNELSPPSEQLFRLAANAQPGTVIGRIATPDYHAEPVSYALEQEHDVFSLEPDGRLILRQAINHNQIQEYKLRATLSDGRRQSIALIRVLLGLGNGVWQQRWDNLAGESLGQLTESKNFPDSPNANKVIPALDLAASQNSSSGYRMLTYLRPDVSGRYQFALSGGGESQLRLSTDQLAVNARSLDYLHRTATENKTIDDEADSVVLEAGRVYYLELLHRQTTGVQPVRVSWKLADVREFSEIPEHLMYLDGLSVGLVKPEILPFDTEILVDSAAKTGDKVVHVPALDLQGDALQFSIENGTLPFSIDQYGTVRVRGALDAAASYTFSVNVSDGTHVSVKSLTVSTSIENALELALQHGDASLVSEQILVDSVNEVVEKQLLLRNEIRTAVFAFAQDGSKTRYSLNAIDWDPSDRSVVFEPHSATGMIPLLVSNAAAKQSTSNNEILAMAGVNTNGARRALLGSNALHDMSATSYPNGSGNVQMNSFMRNLIAWLLDRDDLDSGSLNIVVAHQADSYHFKHDNSTSSWLTQNIPTAKFNAQDVCESVHLKGCLEEADLLIMGQENGQYDNHGIDFDLATTMRAVTEAQEAGLPVLFLPFGTEQNNLAKALLDYFSVESGDNFWRQERLLAYNPHAQVVSPDNSLLALSTTINHLASPNLEFVFDDAGCPIDDEVVRCDSDLVRSSNGGTLKESVLNGINFLRRTLIRTDALGVDIFSQGDEFRLEKLALLLADKYREKVRYPLDKHMTSSADYMRAFYADEIVSYVRTGNIPAESFADKGFARTIRVAPRVQGNWISTGLYARAGQTISVKRKDNNAYAVGLRFNRLRTSPQLWNDHGYIRPRNLISHQVTLLPGQSNTLSTPHGGVIYLWSAGSVQQTGTYSVAFDNVLASPKLSRGETASIQVFASAMAVSPSDWVDIETPYAQIHTLKSRLERVLSEQDGDVSNGYSIADIRKFYADLNNWPVKGKLALAGYTGKDLPPLSAGISRFCSKSGLRAVFYESRYSNLCTDSDVHRLPALQHFSSDITTDCSSHCEPDTLYLDTSITPLDPSLQRFTNRLFESRRLLVYGKQSRQAFGQLLSLYASEVQGSYSDFDMLPRELLPDFKDVNKLLQKEQTAMNLPAAEHALWSDSELEADASTDVVTGREIVSPRLAFYLDLIYSQQGPEFLTQLFLVERIFSHAVIKENRWAAVKDALGFGLYTRADAYQMSGNDFIYIVSSRISRKSYQEFFQSWGVSVSSAANAQVDTYDISEKAAPTVPPGNPAAQLIQHQTIQMSSH